jgi:hypothetical protein
MEELILPDEAKEMPVCRADGDVTERGLEIKLDHE